MKFILIYMHPIRAWGKMRQKIGKCAMRYAIKNKGLCDRLCDETYHHLPITACESCFYHKFPSKFRPKT